MELRNLGGKSCLSFFSLWDDATQAQSQYWGCSSINWNNLLPEVGLWNWNSHYWRWWDTHTHTCSLVFYDEYMFNSFRFFAISMYLCNSAILLISSYLIFIILKMVLLFGFFSLSLNLNMYYFKEVFLVWVDSHTQTKNNFIIIRLGLLNIRSFM